MAGVDLPLRAIREQVASAVDLIVQQSRLKDGTRKIVNITEVQGMEGDVIVMQDVFVFEQTGVVEGKIQGRLKPTGIRPEVRREVRGHGHQPAAWPVRVHVLGAREGATPWTPMTLAVAGVAALAIILIAVGIASSGGSGISERLERYASDQATGHAARQRPARAAIADLIAQSEALANLNTRRRAARLRRQPRPRPRPRRPAPQAVRVPAHLGAARSSASRSSCSCCRRSCRPSATRCSC